MNAPTYNELLCLTFIAHCEKNSNYDPLTTKNESFFVHSNPSSHSTFKSIALTYNIWEIQPSSMCSKWNMGEIFGLKFYLIICTYNTENFIEIPPCAKKVIFITEFAIWCKNPPFYEVKKIFQKRLCAWRNFKIFFSRPLFIIFLGRKY